MGPTFKYAGASLSVMSEKMCKELGGEGQRSTLNPISAKFCTYIGEVIEPFGLARCLVKYGEGSKFACHCHSLFRSSFTVAGVAARVQFRLA